MFGFKKFRVVYNIPYSFEECMVRLAGSERDQTFSEFFQANTTVRVKRNDRTVRINSQRFANEPITVFAGTIHGDSAPVTLSGQYRISIGNRIFSSFGIFAIILMGGGMTVFLTYAAIFATWGEGGGIRFYLPLFPFAFTVGMLCFLKFLSKPNPSIIEEFLSGAIGASVKQQSEQGVALNR